MQVASPALPARLMLQSDQRNPLTFALPVRVYASYTRGLVSVYAFACVCMCLYTRPPPKASNETPTPLSAFSLVPPRSPAHKRKIKAFTCASRRSYVSRECPVPCPLCLPCVSPCDEAHTHKMPRGIANSHSVQARRAFINSPRRKTRIRDRPIDHDSRRQVAINVGSAYAVDRYRRLWRTTRSYETRGVGQRIPKSVTARSHERGMPRAIIICVTEIGSN